MPESCVYDLEDYENIINEGFECNLTKEAMDTISGLAEQVDHPLGGPADGLGSWIFEVLRVAVSTQELRAHVGAQ